MASTSSMVTLSFNSIEAVFIEGAISKMRMEIIVKRFLEKGGCSSQRVNHNTTHVIAVDWKMVVRKFGNRAKALLAKQDLHVVYYDWITECLIRGTLTKEAYFLITDQNSVDLAVENGDEELYEMDMEVRKIVQSLKRYNPGIS
ncbi:hypothetical protein R1flu_026257 [Riccia fluitans]|uniref:BRCT domain-containing protein n=1 Tax=Riccia fluitans TaxID=41844 RepID=A0ABD1XFF7_9MARC